MLHPFAEPSTDAAGLGGVGLPLDRVGAVIKADGRGREGERRDGLVLGDALLGSQRLVGIRHPVDGLTDHLAAQGGKHLPALVIGQVVQPHPVPAPMFLDERDHRIAGLGKEPRKSRKRLSLHGCRQEFKGSGPFHFVFFRQPEWLSSIHSSPP